MQRQVPRPSLNQVTKNAEIPLLHVDKVGNMPVVMARQVPQFQTVLKTGKVPQVQVGSVCTNRSLMCQCLKK